MTKRTPKQQNTAAGKPAVILPSIVTEQDRAIIARREAGETIQAIATSLAIPLSQVLRAEHRAYREQQAQEFFAKHPDSIRGLEWLGVLDEGAGPLRCHRYHYEGGDLERLSDVAALGRHYVSCLKGIGPKSLASIDRALGLFGIVWSPIDRTPKPLPPAPRQEAERQPARSESSAWSRIVRRVGEIEQIMGTGFFEGDPHRDSIGCVAGRLAFLTGYIEGYVEKRRPQKPMRDITPEADSEDLETAGNLICLPGVKLVDVLNNEDRPTH
jgi:hypothetical protein